MKRLAELIAELQAHLDAVVNSGCDIYLPLETDTLKALQELHRLRQAKALTHIYIEHFCVPMCEECRLKMARGKR